MTTDGGGRLDCTWNAWHDHMPPGPARLTVRGTCTMPTPGYELALRPRRPGVNPRELFLELVVTEPDGPVAQVVTTAEATYEEVTDTEYDAVSIFEARSGDVIARVEVREVT